MGLLMNTDWTNAVSRAKGALRRQGRSEHDAEDLMQDAFVRLACYQRQHTVDAPEAFLMKAALNLSIDEYRNLARHGEEVSHEDVLIVDPAPSAEDVQVSRERLHRLRVCLARLNGRLGRSFWPAACMVDPEGAEQISGIGDETPRQPGSQSGFTEDRYPPVSRSRQRTEPHARQPPTGSAPRCLRSSSSAMCRA